MCTATRWQDCFGNSNWKTHGFKNIGKNETLGVLVSIGKTSCSCQSMRHQDGGSLRKLVLNEGNIAKEDAILAQGSNILCYLTQVDVFLGEVVSAVLCLCCDPGDCPSLCWCTLHWLSAGFP